MITGIVLIILGLLTGIGFAIYYTAKKEWGFNGELTMTTCVYIAAIGAYSIHLS